MFKMPCPAPCDRHIPPTLERNSRIVKKTGFPTQQKPGAFRLKENAARKIECHGTNPIIVNRFPPGDRLGISGQQPPPERGWARLFYRCLFRLIRVIKLPSSLFGTIRHHIICTGSMSRNNEVKFVHIQSSFLVIFYCYFYSNS